MDIAVLIALLACVGAVAGVIAGLLGVGGGIVIVPSLYYVLSSLGYPHESLMHVCVATSLATIVPTSIRSVLSHNKKGAVDWAMLRAWAPYVAIGAIIGAFSADFLKTRALMTIFGVVAFAVSLHMAFGKASWRLSDAPPKGASLAGWAGGNGFVSAMMGIGGGTLGVPILSLHDVPIHRAVATAAGMGVLIALPSALIYLFTGLDVAQKPPFTLGYVNLAAFAIITPMTVLCAPYGVKMAHSMNTKALKTAFALFLAIAALNMLRKALYG